jgi:hypothetical protein
MVGASWLQWLLVNLLSLKMINIQLTRTMILDIFVKPWVFDAGAHSLLQAPQFACLSRSSESLSNGLHVTD